MKNINTLLKLEELAELFLAVALFSQLGLDWWLFPACFLLPDLSMLGYVMNSKIGALTYNFFHHKALGIVLYLLGFYWNESTLMFWGTILFGHAAFDRMLGYGLKFPDDFKHTHLGWIGKDRN